MKPETLRRMEVCRHLLPDPAPSIVGNLINELNAAYDCLQFAWEVIANTGDGQGGWLEQSADWVKSAQAWQVEWLNCMSNNPKDNIAPPNDAAVIEQIFRDKNPEPEVGNREAHIDLWLSEYSARRLREAAKKDGIATPQFARQIITEYLNAQPSAPIPGEIP